MSAIDAINSLVAGPARGGFSARRSDRGANEIRPVDPIAFREGHEGEDVTRADGRTVERPSDTVQISEEALSAGRKPLPEEQAGKPGESKSANGEPLSEDQAKQIEQLKRGDRQVRTHEQAHKAAAGGHARGGPQYEFQTGPDGKQYAVGGHVEVDTSPVPGNPQATIQKMAVIQRAATAPAEPSSADRQVAAKAAQQARAARTELQESKNEPDESKQVGGAQESDRTSGTDGASSADDTDDVEDVAAIPGDQSSKPARGADLEYALATHGTAASFDRSSGLGSLIDAVG